MQGKFILTFAIAAALLGFPLKTNAQSEPCAALAKLKLAATEILSAETVPSGAQLSSARPGGNSPFPQLQLPEHCKIRGSINSRTGADNQKYSIEFELRLPANWNGKFLFQGGGGTDGILAPAIGMTGRSGQPALSRGYAVVSTDSGHQGGSNTAFGREQQARLDYAYASIGEVTAVAKAILASYYGRREQHSYFVGCSNGGREAMMAVQRYPLDFDGAVAGDPGFRLSHAAIGEAWDTMTFESIAPKAADGLPILSQAFSNDDLNLVKNAVLEKCDALDGLKDGEINNIEACRFDPAVLTCNGPKSANCLAKAQVDALKRSFNGAHDSSGNELYSSWPYDAGIAGPDWRGWKLGTSPTSKSNAVNVALGGPALKDYFIHPYIPDLDILHVDFDKIAGEVEQTHEINDPTSTDLGTFSARGGKLIIYEGTSDPVFSANDIIAYYKQFMADNGGAEKARSTARLFLVPGMNHCGGGFATDQFDAFTALEKWVEQGEAPASLTASGSAFPNRTRPLCPYPTYATYKGSGDPENAESFSCK